MANIFDKLQGILGGFMKFMYRILAIFGVVSKDDTTGEQLADAIDKFADDIKNA